MEVEMANGKEKVYTWNRVTLRMEMQDPASKAAIDLKAVKVDENTNIPPEKFDVPTEVKFVEH
jgi:hypothetical protein